MNNWTCPECERQWVRNWVFDHERTTCTIGKAEDATQFADYERLQTASQFVRETTAAEATLYRHVTGEDPKPGMPRRRPGIRVPDATVPMTEVIGIAAGIRRRVVAGRDLEEQEDQP